MAIKIIKIKKHTDLRGTIANILHNSKFNIKSVLLIDSKKGTTRGEHYHKVDNHFVYCVSGEFTYSQASPPYNKLESKLIMPGDLVYTPSKIWHSMHYSKDSVMLALATEARTRSAYEKDTKRLRVIHEK